MLMSHIVIFNEYVISIAQIMIVESTIQVSLIEKRYIEKRYMHVEILMFKKLSI